MYMMPLSQLRTFFRRKCGELLPNDVAVYMELFWINNDKDWVEWFAAPLSYLSVMTGIRSRNTIAQTLNRLEQRGFIKIRRGKTRQPNQYSIVDLCPAISSNFERITGQRQDKDRTKTGQKQDKDGTITVHSNRVDKSREEESSTNAPDSDLLTNDNHEGQGELTPAEQQVRSAFETHFRPITKLEELDALRAFTGDYGSRLVVWAIERVSERVQDASKRRRISPRYLLPLLQEESAKKAPAAVPLKPAYDPGRPEGPDNRPPHIPPNWVWTGCGWEEPFVG